MTLEKTTQLYASVLRQLLPTGGYDTSPNTEALAVDVYAHAKLLAQADLDGKRLLKVLEELPPELLPEYETEYGLPLKCTVNASRTIEERIEILKWVRTSRNVLNRTYLEQHLAIFGVVLIDIVKFKPLLCTAPCNSPVNTEQLRYKVFLRLQYPVTADLNCIIENYLPSYLRVEWMIDMPWGDWILNPIVTVNTSGIAHYTAYKTNQREYYDSYANLDLTEAIVRSLYDADMQQWQAVIDSINQLTGVSLWQFDLDNQWITYEKSDVPQYTFRAQINSHTLIGNTLDDVCAQVNPTYMKDYGFLFWQLTGIDYVLLQCKIGKDPYTTANTVPVSKIVNPNYNVTTHHLDFTTIAEKIVSNASVSNEAISLLAETYLENIAQSVFNSDESKQFVRMTDLIDQFEFNKILRT